MKEIEGLLEGIPFVQYVAAGSCGVKYVSKGLEIVCCRPGKEEFTTLATDPLDDKVYQSSKCRFHRGCSDEQYAVQGPAFVECGRLGDGDGAAFTRYATADTMDARAGTGTRPADSRMRPSSLWRYRKQAVQYTQANRGPAIYFITPPRAEDRLLSAALCCRSD